MFLHIVEISAQIYIIFDEYRLRLVDDMVSLAAVGVAVLRERRVVRPFYPFRGENRDPAGISSRPASTDGIRSDTFHKVWT